MVVRRVLSLMVYGSEEELAVWVERAARGTGKGSWRCGAVTRAPTYIAVEVRADPGGDGAAGILAGEIRLEPIYTMSGGLRVEFAHSDAHADLTALLRAKLAAIRDDEGADTHTRLPQPLERQRLIIPTHLAEVADYLDRWVGAQLGTHWSSEGRFAYKFGNR